MIDFSLRNELVFYARAAGSDLHDVTGWALLYLPSFCDVVWC